MCFLILPKKTLYVRGEGLEYVANARSFWFSMKGTPPGSAREAVVS